MGQNEGQRVGQNMGQGSLPLRPQNDLKSTWLQSCNHNRLLSMPADCLSCTTLATAWLQPFPALCIACTKPTPPMSICPVFWVFPNW